MEIQLSDHFTYKKINKICITVYCDDDLYVDLRCCRRSVCVEFCRKDGICSNQFNYADSDGTFSSWFMIGTEAARLQQQLWEKEKKEKANEYFSMLVYVTIIGGIAVSLLGMILIRPIAVMLGAAGELLSDCVLYGRITFISFPAFMLQNVFQSFFCCSTETKLGLKVIIVAGVTNYGFGFICLWDVLDLELQGQQLRQYAENLLADCSRFFILHEKFKSSETWKTQF